MEFTMLRNNLMALNELMTIEDRREFVKNVGIGSHEVVDYLTGRRVPTDRRIEQFARHFGIEAMIDLRRTALDAITTQRAKMVLARYRKERRHPTPQALSGVA